MDVFANFGDSRLQPSEAPFSALFRMSISSDRKYIGVVVDPPGAKVHVKFDDSRSNCSRDIRLPFFVTNDDNGDDNDAGRRSL